MKTLLYIDVFFTLLTLIYIIHKENRIYICFSKNSYFNKITGINVMWNSQPLIKGLSATGLFYIPIRNYKKLKLKEDIEGLMKPNNPNVLYNLSAIFSWLNTEEEIKRFEKDYSIVDKNIVKKLVEEFKTKVFE